MRESRYKAEAIRSLSELRGGVRAELLRRLLDDEKRFYDGMRARKFPKVVTVGGVLRGVPDSIGIAYAALADGLDARVETASWRLMLLCGWDCHLSPTISADGKGVTLFNEKFIFGKRLAHGVYELSVEWMGGDWSLEDAGRSAGVQERER